MFISFRGVSAPLIHPRTVVQIDIYCTTIQCLKVYVHVDIYTPQGFIQQEGYLTRCQTNQHLSPRSHQKQPQWMPQSNQGISMIALWYMTNNYCK